MGTARLDLKVPTRDFDVQVALDVGRLEKPETDFLEQPARLQVAPDRHERVVRLRGGGYFIVPSISAMRTLAGRQDPEKRD